MYIKKSRVIASVIAIVILTAVLTTLVLNPFGIENTDKFLKLSIISRIINSAYYDDIDRGESAEMAIAGVTASTGDPYTQYYWGDTAIKYMEQLQGDYCGVGMYIKCDAEENLITVVSSIPGSPAEEAGITTDDKILKIDGQMYTGEQLNEASDYMRGEEGTDVTLSIRKAKDNSEQELTLTRRKIVIENVSSKMLDNGIGYLNISQFTENISSNVKEHLENLSNDVVLAPYLIIAVAVVLLVILFLMSGSWFEPVLILVVIGLAIPVNMGTNFFLPSVSNTTYSISAILQLVLSMDYSIILMNRYRRERKDGNDKIAAMRTALSGTFSSIVSSAFTTFVGLLMLVFMQYRIGADLGIVLAKGVVCSLLCIFTLLPAMIIFSDKLLSKTRKPSLHIPMGWLAAFSHKLRYALPAVFAGIFVLFLLLQRITPISFDGTPTRQIANVFPENNRIVVLYDNKDSDKIPGLEEELKKYPGVSSVVSYETTLGKERTAEDMLDFLDDLESDVDMQVPDMKLLYYDYFKKGEAPNLKVSDLIMFINDDLLTDPHYAEKMEGEIRDNIKDMVRFADPAALKEKRSFSDLRAFLSGDSGSGEMSDEDVKLMYTYYFTKDENYSPGSMTLNEFISFIQNDIRGNETIASYMDGSGENDFSRIDELARYTERNFILTKRSSADMAKILGISVSRAETVYTLYFGNAAADSFTMALPELLEYLQKNVLTNPEYAGSLPADAKAKLEQLSGLVQLSLSGKSLTSDEMARVLGMDAEQAGQLYMLYAADAAGIPEEQASAAEAAAKAAAVQEAYARLLQAASQTTMTLPEFITFLNEKVLTDPAYSAGFDSSKKAQLSQISQIINTVTSGTALDYKNAAKILGMDASSMRNLYALKAGGEAGNKTLSLYDMVKYILENLSGQFDASTRSKLTQLKNIMNLSLNNTSLTYTEMAKILGGGMDMSDLKNLYVMHDAKLNPDFGKMDLVEFLDFLKSDILTDEKMKEKLTPEREKDLNSLTTMVNAVASETEYNSDELYDLFSSMGDDADRNDMYLLSMMYGSFKDYDPEWKMSMISLFNFISEKVITDERFAGVLDEEDKEKVIENRADMTEYVDQLKGSGHSILLINTRLPYESEETENFVKEIHRLCDERLTGDNYKIGNSPMYHEMQQTFSGEMLFITLLTSGAIFAIVALLAGKYFGLYFLDPVMGLLGGWLILRWSICLIKDTSVILLDMRKNHGHSHPDEHNHCYTH